MESILVVAFVVILSALVQCERNETEPQTTGHSAPTEYATPEPTAGDTPWISRNCDDNLCKQAQNTVCLLGNICYCRPDYYYSAVNKTCDFKPCSTYRDCQTGRQYPVNRLCDKFIDRCVCSYGYTEVNDISRVCIRDITTTSYMIYTGAYVEDSGVSVWSWVWVFIALPLVVIIAVAIVVLRRRGKIIPRTRTTITNRPSRPPRPPPPAPYRTAEAPAYNPGYSQPPAYTPYSIPGYPQHQLLAPAVQNDYRCIHDCPPPYMDPSVPHPDNDPAYRQYTKHWKN